MDVVLPTKKNIIGVQVSDVSFKNLLILFENVIEHKKKIRICVLATNPFVDAQKQQDLFPIFNSADVLLCDGMPTYWASHFLNQPVAQRITGLDLTPEIFRLSAQKKFSIFLLGGSEGVADTLKESMLSKYPNLNIVGTYCPPFAKKFSTEETNKMIHLINTTKPDFLLVSLTAPKQDYFLYDIIDKIDTHIAIGVGGAFSVTAGLIKRAPKWMQNYGLEWFYRFLQEPKRLFKRYFIEAPPFFYYVLKQKFTK
ncbi:MAG: WecB/TagA/CpsF family glycosyltransferase [Sediminibacterium sp.]|nr:WecB/TagA/CpsF family glycosyltransferase [Sediminibacterium sp.]